MIKTIQIFLCFHVACFLFAQTAGNPVQAIDQREWTMGLSGNYLHQQLGNEIAVSKRLLIKSMWGVRRGIGIYGLLGTVQLSMNTNKPGITDYKDKFRFGYGLGLHVQTDLNRGVENSIGLWGGIQVLKFVSKSSFLKSVQFQGENYTREFGMKYDWGEMMMCAGFVVPIRILRLYGGGAGWASLRHDSKKEYLTDSSNSRQLMGEAKGDYQSGVWSGGILGIEFILPNRYSFSVEGLVFNKQNYQIMVGISQTGSPGW